MTASIWVDSNSHWIAAGTILQGLGTIATLILLIWQIISWQRSREEAQMDDLLTDLTDTDPLKRLLAVCSCQRGQDYYLAGRFEVTSFE